MRQVSCSSCGASVTFLSKASLLAVCAHCRSSVVQGDLDVSKIGKIALLQDDGSPIRIGTCGKYDGAGFRVIGRIQMRFDAGFWNEWYLDFSDGRDGWLGEAAGLYGVTFKVENPGDVPLFDQLEIGERVAVGKESFQVRDKKKASYLSAEGELPFAPPLGSQAPVADLAAPGMAFGTIDYSEGKPIVFLGQYREFDELDFSELRDIEGWRA